MEASCRDQLASGIDPVIRRENHVTLIDKHQVFTMKEWTRMAAGDIETYYENGEWKNRPQGNQRASGTYDTKAQAQKAGREMAIDRGVEHVIKKMDGTIGDKNTYPRSRDPRKSKG